MGETSAAIAAAEAKVASVLPDLQSTEASQPAMASNAAPPGLGNAAENVPTPSPYPTSARKTADLSAAPAGIIKTTADTDEKIACADKKIADTAPMSACADEKMESAAAKMESKREKLASAALMWA